MLVNPLYLESQIICMKEKYDVKNGVEDGTLCHTLCNPVKSSNAILHIIHQN